MAKRQFKCTFQGVPIRKNDSGSSASLWRLAIDSIRTVRNGKFLLEDQKRALDIALEAMATLEKTDFLRDLKLERREREHQQKTAGDHREGGIS